MSLNFSPNLSSILQSFNRVGLSQQQGYGKEQIFSALDKLLGRSYDRDVAAQLFDQCQANNRQQVILEDFCQVILEADKILKKKITAAEDQVRQYQQEKKECEIQAQQNHCILQKYLDTQQLNQYGVERDSQLQIALSAAQQIQHPDFACSFVKIIVEQVEQVSNISQGIDKYNPTFNQQFQFNIERGSEEINIQLYVQTRQGQKILVGEHRLDIGQLHDQSVHEFNLQLMDPRQVLTPMYVQIEAQWIYNKPKYYKEMSDKYDAAIHQLQIDNEDYKRDLLIIQEPFLENSQRLTLQQSLKPGSSLNQFAPVTNYPIQNNAFQFQQQNLYNNSVPSPAQNQGFNNSIQRPVAQISSPPGALTDELEYGFVGFIVMLLLAIFQCFARPAYFDVILAMLLLLIIIRDCFETQYIRIVSALNVISIISDIVWISFYKHWWSGTDQTLPAWGDNGVSVVRLTFVFCIFNLILKAGLCYFLYHYYLDSKLNKVVDFKYWQFHYQVGIHKQNIFAGHQELLK